MNKSKILVIGGAGYIGSHVVESLTQSGYTVRVYDDLSNGKKEHLAKKIPLIQESLLDTTALRQAFQKVKPDAVIHLAALKSVGESMSNAVAYSNTNIIGTTNLLNTMVKFNVKKLVFSSSAAVYGDPQYLPIDEEHIKSPTNYYGETKLITEQMMRWYDTVYGIKYIALRYFNAAGHIPNPSFTIIEPDPQNLIPIILEVALGWRKKLQIFGNNYSTPDGTCLRDYIHVSDLADAHVLSLQYLTSQNTSFVANLGTGKGFSVREVYEMTCNVTNKDIPMEFVDRRPGDPASLYAKSVYAQKMLHWKPKYIKIEEIIRHAWDAYLRYQALL